MNARVLPFPATPQPAPTPSAGGCCTPGCTRPARMALGVARATLVGLGRDGQPNTTLGVVHEQVFYDWRAAPENARRLCKRHGLAMLATLVGVYVSEDTEPELDPALEPEDPNTRALRELTRLDGGTR